MTKTPKEACGGCSQCTKTPNPYEEQVEAVWHDPTSYDLVKHGPPYLKLSSDQKAVVKAHMTSSEVRDVLAQQSDRYASLEALYLEDGEPMTPLSWLLVAMQGLAFTHQTAHWQTRGPHFYGDHLLFQRLYTESLPFIDEVAERAVGSGSVAIVDARHQATGIHGMVYFIADQHQDEENPAQRMVLTSLYGETLFLGLLKDVIAILDKAGNLSAGTSNLLEGLADKHEQFVYLLKQRTQQTTTSYSYDRS